MNYYVKSGASSLKIELVILAKKKIFAEGKWEIPRKIWSF